jgi:hypothetical protein
MIYAQPGFVPFVVAACRHRILLAKKVFMGVALGAASILKP